MCDMTDPPLTTDAAVNRLLVAAYEHCMADVARQLETMAEKLDAKVPPGHVLYVSKTDAGAWALALSVELLAMMTKSSALRTVRAGDKVEALLTLANVETPDAPLDS